MEREHINRAIHGRGTLRGLDLSTRSRSLEGRFGRLFRSLPPAQFGATEEDEKDLLKRLAAKMISHDDKERGSKIPAGYTYLGQFIDHDITFDPVSSLQHDNDPEALVNFRTPRFDLDCLYGRGPDDQPYLYQDDGVRLLLGNAMDNSNACELPRAANGRAIIGDPRNDENVIIAQLHSIFMRFHNRMADKLAEKKSVGFSAVQQAVRWHYQWIVLYDFLPRIIDEDTYHLVLPHVKEGSHVLEDAPELKFYKPRVQAFIPVEFSAAAYRFGHSMVRSAYRLNRNEAPDIGGPLPIVAKQSGANPQRSLAGFHPMQKNWGIQWELFFDGINKNDDVQHAFRIDTSLAPPLVELPFKFAKDMPSLAVRNLIRGWRLRLPSGQAVSSAMGIEPLDDERLVVGAASGDEKPKRLADISAQFRGNAPLWYYILAEAQHHSKATLGPVGSRIVMETFVGLMMQDSHSFLRQDPRWKPDVFEEHGADFRMADLITEALKVEPPKQEANQ